MPRALLDPLLFRSATRLLIAPRLLGAYLLPVLVLLLLLSTLRLVVLRRPLLLSALRLIVLRRPLLLLSTLRLIVLRRPLLLLSTLRLLLSLAGRPLRLSMPSIRFGLLVLALLRLGMVLLFALFVLSITRSGDEKQRQNRCAGHSDCFHR